MKAVILGKAGSVRVKGKNYRPFYKDKKEKTETTLVIGDKTPDLKHEIITDDKNNIYLSCEDIAYKKVADHWGINFVLRDEAYTLISTSNVDVVHNVCKDIPIEDDLLWVTPVEPLFDEFKEILECWDKIDKTKHDSLNYM